MHDIEYEIIQKAYFINLVQHKIRMENAFAKSSQTDKARLNLYIVHQRR